MRFAALVFCVCAVSSAFGQEVKVEKFQLANGLTVILHEDHTVPLATINTWFYVGSKDEPERRSGFAHLFEHLMFMGTERVPGSQFDQLMESKGGFNNASTTEDRTNYYSFGPSQILPTLLWLDADRLEDLGRMMDQKKLDLQREVVKNERREGTELAPYGEAQEILPSLLFPKGHPYHTSVIGSHEDLTNATVNDVKDFFATFYVPNNASLVVDGDFKSSEIKALIQKLFGSLPRKNDPPRRDVPPVKLQGEKTRKLVDNVPFEKLMLAWLSPAAYQPGDKEMRLAGQILAGGVSSRLYQRLVVKDKLATAVDAYQNSLLEGSYFVLEVTLAEGTTSDQVKHAVDEEISRLAKSGPTETELKQQASSYEHRVLNALQDLSQRADQMNEYQFYWGEPNSFKRDIDEVRAITPMAIAKRVAETLGHDRVALSVVPRQEVESRADRDTPPQDLTAGEFVAPTSADFTLSNGIPVVYFQRHDVPLVSVQACFGYGSDHDDAKKAGTASLVADMISAGSGSLDAKGFEQALDVLGASMNVSARRTETVAGLDTLANTFPESLKLFAQALRGPSFRPEEWDRVKGVYLADLRASLEEPQSICQLVTNSQYFGATRAGVPTQGTETSVASLTLKDIEGAYSHGYSAANLHLFAAGSLSADKMKEALEQAFGSWKGGSALAPPVYPDVPASPLRVFLVNVPDAPQTVIRFRMPGFKFGDSQRLLVEAVGTILGGTFTSRLNANLREDKGYTYGAGTSAIFAEQYGVLDAGASVRTDVTGASLKEFLKEFAKIRGGDISGEETLKARSTMQANIVQSFASLSSLVGAAAEQSTHHRTVKDLAADRLALGKLTRTQLNSVVPQVVRNTEGVLVLVGDKKAILPQLEGLGLPKPQEVTP